MYIQTMTTAEILGEYDKDLPQILSVCDAKQTKVDKIIRRSALFPVYLHSSVRSKRGNDWLLLFEARSKKEIGDNCRITLISTFDSTHGRYAIMWTTIKDRPVHIIFQPHFFGRYAKRAGIDLSGMELIHRYFKLNNSFGFTTQKEQYDNKIYLNAYGSSSEGIALGYWLNSERPAIFFKTFITYDMCKGQQIESFAQADEIRKEIHEL